MSLLDKNVSRIIRDAQDIIDSAKVDVVYGLFSGGHDSLIATHLASRHPKFAGVIHIDTGTGIRATREFVEQTCAKHGWRLFVKSPVTTYEMLIVKSGFPSPNQHPYMYRYLKERPLNALMKELKQEHKYKNIGLASGVRKQESNVRMHREMEIVKQGVKVFIPVIRDVTALQVNNYVRTHRLDRNPVKDLLHISGECLCGSFAKRSESRDIKMWYPNEGKRIERWERLVTLAREQQEEDRSDGLRQDVKIKPKFCQWGHHDSEPNEQSDFLHLCHTCQAMA